MEPHETQTRLHYHDTDQMGIVHYAQYLVYFEIGRTEFLRDRGCAHGARLGNPKRIERGRKIANEAGQLLCDGSTVLACVDAQGKPRPLRDDLAALVKSKLDT